MAVAPRPEARQGTDPERVSGAPASGDDAHSSSLHRFVLLGVGAVVLVRLIVTALTPLELAADEAQYWRWAQTPDWGYFSKPPFIAWVIAASTSLFGDAEWAIRAPAALLHGGAAIAIYTLGQRAFDQRVGAWAAAVYLLMPGVAVSSAVMSTDAVLLPLWTLALLCLWRLRDRPGVAGGTTLGLVIGLAMLAKYAALYLLVGAILAAIVDRATRRALLSPAGAAAAAALLLTLTPNLLWNAANDFATVSHTTENANWGDAGFKPEHLLKFIGDQMAVFGPMSFGLLVAAFALRLKPPKTAEDSARLWLACFVLPPLLVIAGQAMISRAHANWAATAYPAASVLIASFVAQARWGATLKAGVALNLLACVFVVVVALAPALADRMGLENALKRTRGWSETATELAARARSVGATAILIDEREVWHEIDYYGRELDLPPHRLWRRHDEPRSFAEAHAPLVGNGSEDQLVLVVSHVPEYRPRMRADFQSFDSAGNIEIRLSPNRYRILKLYTASGFKPLARDAAYEARFKDQSED